MKLKILSPFRVILGGFALLILLGAVLLSLPISSAQGEPTPFVDSLFTSTETTALEGDCSHLDAFELVAFFVVKEPLP